MARKLLLPGQYCVTDQAMILETLVGSCVAVCMYNRKQPLCAMNHFVLDRPPEGDLEDVGRYGTTSTERIIQMALDRDSLIGHYEAMVFGGASVLETGQDRFDVGRRNLEAAMEILAQYRLRIVRAETCGSRGRRIQFDTQTHSVDCRFCGDIPRKQRPLEINLK
ncbi:MAG: chemotaxis protein CheD [Phycisphaerae bacterium]|nr:chemotaxis protein CheD [Phycisphaerae bacterium]